MSGDRGSQDLDDDDDMPELSAHALAALQEFYTEQQQVQEDASALPVEDWVTYVLLLPLGLLP